MLPTSWAHTDDRQFGQCYIYSFTPTYSYHTPAKHQGKTQLQPHTTREMLKFSSFTSFFQPASLKIFQGSCRDIWAVSSRLSLAGLGDSRLPMLHSPSGYSQPCAEAAFLSAHSLHHSSVQDTTAAVVSSSSLLLELLPRVSAHVFGKL